VQICGARTRAGTPCRRPAGWGTDHPGRGRCKLHGGRAGPPKGNRNAVKHGLYERVVRERLTPEEQALFDAVSTEPDLQHELRILRFKLLRLLEPVVRKVAVPTPEGTDVVALEVDEVTKAYAIEKLADGIRKIVKDLQGAGEDAAIDKLVEALAASRREAQGAGGNNEASRDGEDDGV